MARRLAQLAQIPVTELRGVGPKLAGSLEAVGVTSVLDLLTYYPRRYIDRSRSATVDGLHLGEEATVLVRIKKVSTRKTRNRKTMVIAEAGDDTGSVRLTFFNQPWRSKQLEVGIDSLVFGKLESFQGRRQMTNPVVDLIGDRTGRIVPVYPQSEKARLMSWDVARLMGEVLERAGEFADPLGNHDRDRFELTDRTTAYRRIHEPATMSDVTLARKRLVFDELLRVQLELVRRKRELERTTAGFEHETAGLDSGEPVPGSLVEAFISRLPFDLTGAQRRAMAEIAHDLALSHPMHRLLQGDVGAGKTLVAVASVLVAVQGGYQAALMVPTEVLAEQHYASITAVLDGLEIRDASQGSLFESEPIQRPLRVALLTNRTRAAQRRTILEGLGAGEIELVIGTHALIQEQVELASLGLIIIDEQHRFGVEQRAALREHGSTDAVPDVLVMTATPIPRTAAMTVYGDLDVSVLDELPPGRTPVETSWARDDQEVAAVWAQVRDEVGRGRQAYVVCPLIEESDKLQVASAEETFETLVAPGGELADLRVGVLHGRIGPADKERTMAGFRSGELDVLVATTVIEVGVDVANATVMVILDADRFGIAQLHQLRGRVGRGDRASTCFLVADPTDDDGVVRPDAQARLEALVASTDGFELAEVDLDLRGEGTLMGERQKGRNDLRLASLRRDRDWVERAREVAFEIIDDDPTLERHPLLAEEIDLVLGDDDEAGDYLLKS